MQIQICKDFGIRCQGALRLVKTTDSGRFLASWQNCEALFPNDSPRQSSGMAMLNGKAAILGPLAPAAPRNDYFPRKNENPALRGGGQSGVLRRVGGSGRESPQTQYPSVYRKSIQSYKKVTIHPFWMALTFFPFPPRASIGRIRRIGSIRPMCPIRPMWPMWPIRPIRPIRLIGRSPLQDSSSLGIGYLAAITCHHTPRRASGPGG
jgi:hypothetical protein